MMTTRRFQIQFLTPAFLGNAEQSGQWRTPPIKALLRQWWRVAWVKAHDYSDEVAQMRREEGALFGAAANESCHRSLVRLRLDKWDAGRLTQWPSLNKVKHPEVNSPIDAGLYLGYGPLIWLKESRQVVLKKNAAIQSGESAELRIAFPSGQAGLLDQAFALMANYGTLGGRSRNGWGSFTFDGDLSPDAPPLRDWIKCLERDWPHAIGSDDTGPLIWQTETFEDWKPLMHRLAEIKIGLRTQFAFPDTRPPHPQPLDRHWLAYPITKHGTRAWDRGDRLPNSLRFKVRTNGEDKLVGMIFHVPCRPPSQFRPDLGAITSVWKRVHKFLDNQQDLQRCER